MGIPEVGAIYYIIAPFNKVPTNDAILNMGVRGYDCKQYWSFGYVTSREGDEIFRMADGEGILRVEVIKIVDMPAPYVDRIIFRKKTIDPDGLHGKWKPIEMLGPVAFNSLISGKRWEYDLP